ALQISGNKTYPWPNAANIKYPLLATAAMQFAARAYPTLVPSDGKIVKCRVIGFDHDGEKTKRAERISKHMSYQVLEEMEDWEEDMDKLLICLPIAGTCFKKTYWNPNKQRNCSILVLPKTLVVNYFCRRLEEAERITEVLTQTKRKVKELQNQGLYLDIKLSDPSVGTEDPTKSINEAFQNTTSEDNTTPYIILEQHTYLDLDQDGYSEPYIVTVELDSHKVLRIIPRFNGDSVIVDEKSKVISIEATQYYTKYSFIPNPDGGFYDLGFGRLLGPLNNSANTIINQLVDAGSLSNLQSGFIGKGLRIKMGETKFVPGEWKAVNATGDDIKKQIFALPVREPSDVLFKLLDLLLKSGKELASVAEIFVGKMPGQNTPATTTMATIEQGMKVFTSVYKRVYRSLASEFKKIYKLNREYMNNEEYISVLDEPVQQEDYKGPENDIYPGADPTAVSSQEKQAKIQAVMQLLQLGTIDPMAVTMLYLEAHEIPNPEKLMKQPQPQPDPKMEAIKAKAQVDQQKAQIDMQVAQHKMQLEQATKEQELQMKAAQVQQELEAKKMQAILDAQLAQATQSSKIQMDQQAAQAKMGQQAQQSKLNMVTQAMSHQQTMQQQAEQHKQQQKQIPKGTTKK
ncbi:MAG TPA: cell envelope integrity protein TolA, partial [Candidatus Dojkabacteria bacterium]|nr:cell envelope integrity protein TolA [Candidatus Dojkabacteria bacterium]